MAFILQKSVMETEQLADNKDVIQTKTLKRWKYMEVFSTEVDGPGRTNST